MFLCEFAKLFVFDFAMWFAVDGVVPGGQAREVANNFDFAYFGESSNAVGAMVFAEFGGRVRGRDIKRRQLECALSRRRFLKNQAFVLRRVARSFVDLAVHRGWSSARRSAEAKRSISARVVVSVTQTRAVLVSSG